MKSPCSAAGTTAMPCPWPSRSIPPRPISRRPGDCASSSWTAESPRAPAAGSKKKSPVTETSISNGGKSASTSFTIFPSSDASTAPSTSASSWTTFSRRAPAANHLSRRRPARRRRFVRAMAGGFPRVRAHGGLRFRLKHDSARTPTPRRGRFPAPIRSLFQFRRPGDRPQSLAKRSPRTSRAGLR